jgi:hypothetical protein
MGYIAVFQYIVELSNQADEQIHHHKYLSFVYMCVENF